MGSKITPCCAAESDTSDAADHAYCAAEPVDDAVEVTLVATSYRILPDAPCFHDLIALFPVEERQPTTQAPDDIYGTYRVFEVWPSNFQDTCQLLYDKDWLDEGICPLVLSHFQLSASQVARLPRNVSWRRISISVEQELEALRQVLVAPLETRGMPCVDFVEFIAALTCGGELRIWRAHGATANDAFSKVFEQANADKSTFANAAACCLGIRMPRPIHMEDLDHAMNTVESLLPEKSFLVPSARLDLQPDDTFQVSLMSVMAR